MATLAAAGTWDGLKLTPAVLEIVRTKLGFQMMTPVQAHTISPFLSYKDVAVEAPTGSGKTLAFVIPMFEMLLRRKEPLKTREIGAIIISPTRELATQISRVVEVFASELKFTSLLVIGGTAIQEDVARWRKNGAQILVGTPGRMLYFLQEVNDLKLRELDVLILDEADRLLDLGFEVTLNSILTKLPKQRRTGLFSATQTKEVEELVRAGLRNPMYIQVKVENKATAAPQKIPATLKNFVMKVTSSEKLSLLVQFLASNPRKKFIVYFLTCACVDYFWMILSQLPELKNLRLSSLHGKVPHARRSAIFQRFVVTSGEQGAVLMTTDVAARGLDLPDVDWIIQYDLPQDPQMYVHRIGRTARMGREGSAVAYLTPQEDAYIAFLRKALEVPVEELPKPDTAPLFDRVRDLALKDYMIVKKSHIAFVSYVRAYREHKCSYLLPWKLLDFGDLANGFCLLALPRMPELQGKELSSFKAAAVDLNAIPYKDATMEKQRRIKQAAQALRRQGEAEAERKRPAAAVSKHAPAKLQKKKDTDDSADEEEIMREYALMKKQKKRKGRRDDREEGIEPEGDGDASDDVANEEEVPELEGQEDDRSGVGAEERSEPSISPPVVEPTPAMEASTADGTKTLDTDEIDSNYKMKQRKKRKHKKPAFLIPLA